MGYWGTGRVGYGKELNYPGYLGQCMVGRVSYLGRVKQGNYHTRVLYTIPNPNYTLPKPYPFIITYPIHPLLWIPRLGECYPVQVSATLPWLPTYPYPSIVIPYPSTYPTYPIHVTSAYVPVPTSHYLLLHTPTCISLPYTIARA